jgi:hypothetical protein
MTVGVSRVEEQSITVNAYRCRRSTGCSRPGVRSIEFETGMGVSAL